MLALGPVMDFGLCSYDLWFVLKKALKKVVETSEISKHSNLSYCVSNLMFFENVHVSTGRMQPSSGGMKFCKILKKLKSEIREEGRNSSRVQNNP
jgi:hypothetical protein